MNARLTIIAAPRAAEAPHDGLQRAAARNWRRLSPNVEVLLLGDEPGMDELAHVAAARRVPLALRTQTGRPRLDEVFRRAQAEASTPLVAFVNADILLRSILIDVVVRLREQIARPFLAVSRRIEVDPPHGGLPDMDEWALQHLANAGQLAPPYAIDFFAFDRGELRLPAFAIGAAAWDNWMIYNALRRGLPVIDLSDLRAVIHQNHDEGYAAGKVPDWTNAENAANLDLAGLAVRFDVRDATHELYEGALRAALGRRPVCTAALHRALAAETPVLWRVATSVSGWWRRSRDARWPTEMERAVQRRACKEPAT